MTTYEMCELANEKMTKLNERFLASGKTETQFFKDEEVQKEFNEILTLRREANALLNS